MGRMTKIDENIQTAQNMLSGIIERCYELEEENKKLKEKIELLDNENICLNAEIKDREEENKNLKAIIDHYKKFEEGKNKLEGMLMEEDTLQELRDLGKI